MSSSPNLLCSGRVGISLERMVGRTIGHYRILQKIGEGGVGCVYLAEDIRLDRKVALKVLAQPSPNPEQHARFEREAKAAAALDHPNILAIHEFGHDGAIPYVVMELLDGGSLRQRLDEGGLPVRSAVDYAVEIAKGLAAAHEKGICHRDLKPENIFITRDNRVKVVDFGLANIRGSTNALLTADSPEVTHEALTKPGFAVGTVGYMAPEQVRGERVDARADLFAFGAVLFEMFIGRRAFDEPTAIETLHDILKAPAPLHLLEQAGVPEPLVRIVGCCLEKERDQRFHSAGDLISALRAAQTAIAESPRSMPDARHRLDSWKEIASYLGRGVRTVQRWEREEKLPVHRLDHAKRGSVYAEREELARWWESRQRVGPTPTRTDAETARRPAETAAIGPPKARGSEAKALAPFERVTYTSVVTLSPALSSDARMIVYVSDGGQEGVGLQIWLQQVGGAAMRLTSGRHGCADPTFSADDTKVLFTARGEATLNVYVIPTLGGELRLLKRNARSARMSPDGRWLAYVPLESTRGVRIDRTDGEGSRTIAQDLANVSFAVWSPDSANLLVRGHPDSRFEPDYWVAPLDGGPVMNTGIIEKVRTRGTVLDLPPVWVGDCIIFSVGGRDGTLLWRQRLTPDTFCSVDEAEPLTRGTEWAVFPTAAGRRLAFVNAHADMNLWSISLDESTGTAQGSLRRITRGPSVLGHLCLAADGRTLAYFSARTGMPNVFLRDFGTGSERLVDAPPANLPKAFPTISPDARQLAYSVAMPGPRAIRPIFLLDLATGTSRQLCDDCGGRPRQWLDNTSILVETFGSRLNAFIVVDATTGVQHPLLASIDRSAANPRVSPDGDWIAFDATHPGGAPTVFVAPIGRRTPIAESDWITVAEDASHPFWSRDGRLLYYLPTRPIRDLRGEVRARRLDAMSGHPEGDSFVAASLTESFVPTFVAGTTPIVARDQIVFVLADLQGDIFMMDV